MTRDKLQKIAERSPLQAAVLADEWAEIAKKAKALDAHLELSRLADQFRQQHRARVERANWRGTL